MNICWHVGRLTVYRMEIKVYLQVSEKVPYDNSKDISDDPKDLNTDSGSNDITVVSRDNDRSEEIVVSESNMNEISRNVVKKVEGMALLSMPLAVREFDPYYISNISFAIDVGEERQWRYLRNMGDIYECNPEVDAIVHLFDEWSYSTEIMLDMDHINYKETSIETSFTVTDDFDCIKCQDSESVFQEYEAQLEHRIKDLEKLDKDNVELRLKVQKLSSMALEMSQELKKRDIRIHELVNSDYHKREYDRLERLVEISDDRAECLERKLESSLLEITGLKDNLHFYMDENIKIKNTAKVKNPNSPIDTTLIVEKDVSVKIQPKPVPKPRPPSSFRSKKVSTVSISSESSESVSVSKEIGTNVCEVVTLMGIGTVVGEPFSRNSDSITNNNHSIVDFQCSMHPLHSISVNQNQRTVSENAHPNADVVYSSSENVSSVLLPHPLIPSHTVPAHPITHVNPNVPSFLTLPLPQKDIQQHSIYQNNSSTIRHALLTGKKFLTVEM